MKQPFNTSRERYGGAAGVCTWEPLVQKESQEVSTNCGNSGLDGYYAEYLIYSVERRLATETDRTASKRSYIEVKIGALRAALAAREWSHVDVLAKDLAYRTNGESGSSQYGHLRVTSEITSIGAKFGGQMAHVNSDTQEDGTRPSLALEEIIASLPNDTTKYVVNLGARCYSNTWSECMLLDVADRLVSSDGWRGLFVEPRQESADLLKKQL